MYIDPLEAAELQRFHRAIFSGTPVLAGSVAAGGVRHAEEQGDPVKAGRWLRAVAFAYYHQGDIRRSTAALQRAVDIQTDDEERAHSLIALAGRKGFMLGQDVALLDLGRAQEISDSRPKNLRLKASLLHGRALVLERLGQVEHSLADSKEASRLYLNMNADCLWYAAASLNSSGLCIADNGNPTTGLEQIRQALEIAERVAVFYASAGIRDSLGYGYVLTGEYDKAEHALKESERLFSTHGYKLELLGNIINLSLLYERTRKWEAAERHARRAVKLAEELKVVTHLTQARRQLDSVLANMPRFSDKAAPFHGIIHTSPQMREVINRIRTLAPIDEFILILGETGTGKELAARAVHLESKRRNKPFIPFNCAALSRDLVESRLFGHRRGSFTGADRDHLGIIRAAAGGTVFLDEIGDLSLEAQGVLLRFLQSGEIQPLGFNQPIDTDVRVIAATNRDLREEAEAGRFRKDLYYRLNVATLFLPPLWSRRDDIRELVHHFAGIYSQRYNAPRPVFDEAQMSRLLDYEWPGNVRELENFVKRRVLFGQAELLNTQRPRYVDGRGINPAVIDVVASTAQSELTWHRLNEGEKRRALLEALEQARGNVSAAARRLGISRRTIQRANLRANQGSESGSRGSETSH